MSPDHSKLAFTVDFSGAEKFELFVRDLASKSTTKLLVDVRDSLEWAATSDALFYTRFDETQRPYQVWRKDLGADAPPDRMLLEEPDQKFEVSFHTTNSGKYIIVSSRSGAQETLWAIDASADSASANTVPLLTRHADEPNQIRVSSC